MARHRVIEREMWKQGRDFKGMEWENGRKRKIKTWPQSFHKLLADTPIDCPELFQRAWPMLSHRNIHVIHNNLWNENLPRAPHLWEAWVGFI